MSHPEITIEELRALANYASVALNTLPKELTVGGVGLIKRVEKWIAAMEEIEADPVAKREMAENVLQSNSPFGLYLERSLVLSTGHITLETSVYLSNAPDLIVYAKGDVGWWVFVVDSQFYPDIPEDLKLLLKYANHAGCDWLMLDRDGPVFEQFPAYEW